MGVAVDAAGNAYVVGTTYSRNFPTTQGAIATAYNADLGPNEHGHKGSGFALKLDAAGGSLLYSTLLLEAAPRSVAVDASGHAYVTGSGGEGFPTTPGAFQPKNGRDVNLTGPTSDAIVAKLNPTGTALVYSTFLGGGTNDIGWDIAVDTNGNAYVTGLTNNNRPSAGVLTTPFPTNRPPFEVYEGETTFSYHFATKFTATGELVYSVLLGGANGDHNNYGPDIAVDAAGNA